jgi:hypothetical protein
MSNRSNKWWFSYCNFRSVTTVLAWQPTSSSLLPHHRHNNYISTSLSVVLYQQHPRRSYTSSVPSVLKRPRRWLWMLPSSADAGRNNDINQNDASSQPRFNEENMIQHWERLYYTDSESTTRYVLLCCCCWEK